MPAVVEADVEVMSGAEVVCLQWAGELVGAVNVSSGGVLWFAGGGRGLPHFFVRTRKITLDMCVCSTLLPVFVLARFNEIP